MAASVLPGASKCHDPNFALQKYLLLQSQHESLQHHMDEMRPAINSSPSTSTLSTMSTISTPDASPTLSQPSRSFADPGRGKRRHHRSGGERGPSPCLETIVDETTLHRLATEERKLFDVNEGIKRALTELLNCEAVRADKAFRMWVQSRLMETEKELRSGRRKRGAAVGLE